MIYFMRHACRADNGPLQEINLIENPWDPHITKTGIYQSFMVGERLSFQIPDPYNKKFLVVSSPYLRCLKTAESIVNGFKGYIKLVGDQIYIEDALMEHQSVKYFPENHFQSLSCFQKKVIIQNTAYNALDLFSNIRQKDVTFPESRKQLYNRFLMLLKILETFATDPSNKDTVLIMVGHGYFVSFLHAYLRQNIVFDYPFLSTSKLYFDKEQNKIEADFLDEVLY